MVIYIREANPTENLIAIVTYATQCWAPTMFEIVLNPGFEDASFHYLNYIIRSRVCLSQDHWLNVKKCFIKNSHPAHPETIIYCALVSSFTNDEMRRRALHMILAARNRERNRRVNKVRKFQYPNALVNFDAQTIFELLDLDRLPQSYITAPPLFRNFSDKDLILFYDGKKIGIS